MRHGYYVDGRRYSFEQRAQAVARATWLCAQYGRNVDVRRVGHEGGTKTEYRAVTDLYTESAA